MTGAEREKTSMSLPTILLDAARHRAIDEKNDVQDVIADALAKYFGIEWRAEA